MTEYLVFPIPIGLVKVKASNAEVARNKYRKAMPEMGYEELIIVPSSFAQKTLCGSILPLYKCTIEKI
jgi:hypothetical protein